MNNKTNNKKLTANTEQLNNTIIRKGSQSIILSDNGNVTFNSEFGKLHLLNQ